MRTTCPETYASDEAGTFKLVLLRLGKDDRWRAGVVADGELVIEGPQANGPSQALNDILDAISDRLAKYIQRAWNDGEGEEGKEVKIGVKEDRHGARFAVEKPA